MWTRLIARLRRRHDAADREVTDGQRAADQALGRAEADRARLEAQRPEVQREARRWKVTREENHFPELIRRTVLGGEGG
ncbi:DUF7620 family protein [Streptomyces sp. 900105245]